MIKTLNYHNMAASHIYYGIIQYIIFNIY